MYTNRINVDLDVLKNLMSQREEGFLKPIGDWHVSINNGHYISTAIATVVRSKYRYSRGQKFVLLFVLLTKPDCT